MSVTIDVTLSRACLLYRASWDLREAPLNFRCKFCLTTEELGSEALEPLKACDYLSIHRLWIQFRLAKSINSSRELRLHPITVLCFILLIYLVLLWSLEELFCYYERKTQTYTLLPRFLPLRTFLAQSWVLLLHMTAFARMLSEGCPANITFIRPWVFLYVLLSWRISWWMHVCFKNLSCSFGDVQVVWLLSLDPEDFEDLDYWGFLSLFLWDLMSPEFLILEMRFFAFIKIVRFIDCFIDQFGVLTRWNNVIRFE